MAHKDNVSFLPGEKAVLAALLVISLATAALFIERGWVDTDEPAFIHIAWAWTKGLVPYRDVFDNHTPLWPLLMAPAVAAAGERSDIVVIIRFVNLVSFAALIAASYLLARRFFSRPTALWTIAAIAFIPLFNWAAIEARPDALATAAWLAAIVALVRAGAPRRRGLLCGLFLGLAFCVSQKAIMMTAALAIAAIALPLVSAGARRAFVARDALRLISWTILGMIAPLALLAALVVSLGALKPFLYCVFTHNLIPGEGPGLQACFISTALLALSLVAAWIVDGAARKRGIEWPLLYLFLCGGAFAALLPLWGIVTRQTTWPLFPPLFIVIFGLFFERLRRTPARLSLAASAFVILVEIGVCAYDVRPWRDGTLWIEDYVSRVVRLTKPSDYVMDEKGASIFRRRAFYYTLEHFTLSGMRLGLIADDVPARLAATGACVVASHAAHYSEEEWTFVEANYLPVAPDTYVAGQALSGHDLATASIRFRVAIPAQYVVLSGGAPAAGTLDGTPYAEPRVLAVGDHEWKSATGSQRRPNAAAPLVLFWAQAFDRGFSPLAPI